MIYKMIDEMIYELIFRTTNATKVPGNVPTESWWGAAEADGWKAQYRPKGFGTWLGWIFLSVEDDAKWAYRFQRKFSEKLKDRDDIYLEVKTSEERRKRKDFLRAS